MMTPMSTVLVTGFEPFGSHVVNPTAEALPLLPASISGARIVTAVLPVVYGRCGEVALALIDEHRPDAVLLTGLAAGEQAVTTERIAINVRDTSSPDGEGFPDNSGFAPVDGTITDGGPDGVFATLPNRAITDRLNAAGIPTTVSSTAGTYICNETMYAVLTSLAAAPPPVPLAGFMHVPDVDVLPIPDVARAMELAIEVIVETLALSHPRPFRPDGLL